MTPRRRSATAAVALLALLVALPLAAAEALGTNMQSDPAGDGPKTVDIRKVKVARSSSAYTGVVTFTDLKPTSSTRRLLWFTDDDSAGRQTISRKGNVVELRISPGGTVSVRNWKYDVDSREGHEVACAGVKAVPSYDTDKVYVTIPRRCWYPQTSAVQVYASAQKYGPGYWTTELNDLLVPGFSDETDGFLWVLPSM